MVKNYIIFTPIKESWPKDTKSNLILVSESALLSKSGSQKNYKDHYINESTWENKKKFSKDFYYLENIYQKLLILISKQLNQYHKKNLSIRFWKILIGPWISTFIHIYFERWHNVKNSLKKKKVERCIMLKLDHERFIPYDHKDFIYFSQNDLWNQYLYQNIISIFLKKKQIIQKNFPIKRFNAEISNSILNKFYKKNLSEIIKKSLMRFFNFFNHRNDKLFIYTSYLGFKNELKLSLRLKQLPIFIINEDKIKINKVNNNIREKISNLLLNKNEFEKNLIRSIGSFFPKIFIENFEDLEKFSNKANLPKKPKTVFTSNSLWYDTKLAFHVANILENYNSKLIHGQHGGSMGITKHHWAEKHEVQISDVFLSWGWKSKKENRVKKFYILKNYKKMNYRRNSLLIPLKPRKRYFHSLESSSGIESYLRYIKQIGIFLKDLNADVIANTILRPPYKNISPEDTDDYLDLSKKYNFENTENFNQASERSKIVVHQSNSTPVLETMSANIPTIMILDKYHNPIRNDAKFFFKCLKESNILFYKQNLAAKFINDLWPNNIDTWWYSNKTQNAVKLFVKNYAKKNDRIVDQCYQLLTKI